jgi:glucokinase
MTRPPVLVIDIGGTKIAAGIAFSDGRIEHQQTRRTFGSAGKIILHQVIELARVVMAMSKTPPSAVGVSTGGDVDRNTGSVVYATTTIPDWQGIPLRAQLESALGLPVSVENDGNAMALGEALYGAGRGQRCVIGIVVGTGIGGGIVIDRKLYRGAQGFAGRLGHIIVDYSERQPCTCGATGCLEAYAASLALVADFRKQIGDTRIRELGLAESFGVKEIAELAEAGYAAAAEVIARGAFFLGIGIASLLNLLNPDIVIIGGGVAQIGTRYLEEVRRVAYARAQRSVKDTPIVPALLGTNANLIGAAEVAWQAIESR